MAPEFMSVWEVAHRLENLHPDETDPGRLPLGVLDAIRYFSQAVITGELPVFLRTSAREPDLDATYQREWNPVEAGLLVETDRAKWQLADFTLHRTMDKDALDGIFLEARSFTEWLMDS